MEIFASTLITFFRFSFSELFEWERDFWVYLERSLRSTISLMSKFSNIVKSDMTLQVAQGTRIRTVGL